ncbi:hypothetical protein F5B17DRAFT_424884 [Nemania serpens]|nr:hypothetical protein F5B17DRAFT_424884 [Nemania serpens]
MHLSLLGMLYVSYMLSISGNSPSGPIPLAYDPGQAYVVEPPLNPPAMRRTGNSSFQMQGTWLPTILWWIVRNTTSRGRQSYSRQLALVAWIHSNLNSKSLYSNSLLHPWSLATGVTRSDSGDPLITLIAFSKLVILGSPRSPSVTGVTTSRDPLSVASCGCRLPLPPVSY